MDKILAIGVVLGLIISGYSFFKQRKNVKMIGPFTMYHTKRGVHFIDKVAQKCPYFWKVFSTIGIGVGVFFMVNIFYALLVNFIYIVKSPVAVAGAALAIPGVTIPFVGGLIGIIVLLISHEFSHGFVARAEKIKIKSVGTLSLGFLPLGAFVEPEKKQLEKAKPLAQLRVYVAGSFMNVVLALLILLFIAFVFIPTFTEPVEGVYLIRVEEESPAELAGLKSGMVITSVENKETLDLFSFVKTLDTLELKGGETIQFRTTEQTFEVTTIEKNNRGYIGISFCGKIPEKDLVKGFVGFPFILRAINPDCYPVTGLSFNVFWSAFNILIWIIILNYGVGLVNLLPLKPLDGGLMVESIVKKITKNKYKREVRYFIITISLISLFLLLANFIGPYLRGLIV